MKKLSPRCPDCNHPFYLKFQAQEGTPFWGCPMYPACRKTLSIHLGEMDHMTYHLKVALSIMEGWVYPESEVDLAYQAYRLAATSQKRPLQ